MIAEFDSTITCRLPAEVYKALKRLAKKRKISVSELIRNVLTRAAK